MDFRYIWYKMMQKIPGSGIHNSTIHKTSKIEANSIVINSEFDKYSFCGYNCKIINATIGSFVSIADGVKIGVAEHPIDWVSSSPAFYSGRDSIKMKFSQFDREEPKQTIIEHDVWIGENVIIKAGIKIGIGAIIGMGAVVTRDVLPYEIVGGVPAKRIRFRFDEDTIFKLLDSEWWELDEEKLKKHAQYIRNPELFLKEIIK